jgi:hypothetical protein
MIIQVGLVGESAVVFGSAQRLLHRSGCAGPEAHRWADPKTTRVLKYQSTLLFWGYGKKLPHLV